jgi:hypothetical protein
MMEKTLNLFQIAIQYITDLSKNSKKRVGLAWLGLD